MLYSILAFGLFMGKGGGVGLTGTLLRLNYTYLAKKNQYSYPKCQNSALNAENIKSP